MAILRYLAMTAAEFQENRDHSRKIGWMSCLFSPYGTGLSNLPRVLPAGSLLILSDYTPMQGHDPEIIAGQLTQCVDALHCSGVLLDFQRPGNGQQAALVQQLVQALPCPVAVSEVYARELDCPVFLSPVPPSTALRDYLAPWQGREIWLELALNGEVITLTEKGAETVPLSCIPVPEDGFSDDPLHCHYRIETTLDSARFTLWRTAEDLDALLEEAEGHGVTTGVGLWQELGVRN